MTTPVKILRNNKNKSALIGKSGKIIAWTIVRTAARNFNHQAPYPVAIVQFESGERVIGQVVDWVEGDLKTGTTVEAVLRRAGTEDKRSVISYSIKFRPSVIG